MSFAVEVFALAAVEGWTRLVAAAGRGVHGCVGAVEHGASWVAAPLRGLRAGPPQAAERQAVRATPPTDPSSSGSTRPKGL
jgi:hypothetical protein